MSYPPPPAPGSSTPVPDPKRQTTTSTGIFGFWKGKPEPQYPPPIWDGDTKQTDPDLTAATQVSLPETPSTETQSHLHMAGKGETTSAISNEAPVQAKLVEEPAKGHTASFTLAQRIRELIPAGKGADHKQEPIQPLLHSVDSPPAPLPPPPWLDAQIARLLESAESMNGTISQSRQSVWNALDRLRAPKESQKPDHSDKESKYDDGSDSDSESDDESGVMLYAPLVPNNDSKLELAEREIVKTDASGRIISVTRDEPAHDVLSTTTPVAPTDNTAPKRRRTWWPIKSSDEATTSNKKKSTSGITKSSPTTEPDPASTQTFAQGLKRTISQKLQPTGLVSKESSQENLVDGLKRKVSQKVSQSLQEHALWVPSPDKLSFQATWWGYRIYLPPPVLAVLDDKSLEATKRAAMLTTALQWLFNKLPLAIVPPQLKPGVMLAKRFVPYVGYIGAAIAWSWSSVKGYDKGQGVVMSATWILPLAVLPSTWDDSKYPKPQAPEAPAVSATGISIPVNTV